MNTTQSDTMTAPEKGTSALQTNTAKGGFVQAESPNIPPAEPRPGVLPKAFLRSPLFT